MDETQKKSYRRSAGRGFGLVIATTQKKRTRNLERRKKQGKQLSATIPGT